ncbi:hypothetical protein FJT64_012924 [Amphibalanus amphitrite]|uniref:Gustatory receptor n=1 Tax=Amphibalanus amphitrite TaxID=1232801 RepID=A0A6A4VBR8_AMPAM|nr:hypothetical protein FJT64_012924 [Amphibalanus amphitrite]
MSVQPFPSGQSKKLEQSFLSTIAPLVGFQRLLGHVNISPEPGSSFAARRSWRVYAVLLNVFLVLYVIAHILPYYSSLREHTKERGLFMAFAHTEVYGLGPLLRITAILLNVSVTGKKVGAVLSQLQSVCDVLSVESATFAAQLRRFRRLSVGLLALLSLLAAVEAVLDLLRRGTGCPAVLGLRHCGWHLLLAPGRFVMSVSYVMVSGQLLLISLLCAAGLRCVHEQLRQLHPEQPQLAERLRQLSAQHQQLVDAHRQLLSAGGAAVTCAMTAALLAAIISSCLVSWGMSGAISGGRGQPLLLTAALTLQTLAAAAVLAASAEAGQQLLQPLGDAQRHLLRLETRPAGLADRQRRRYLAELEHDLGTAGDLGLFRLHRPLGLAVFNIVYTSALILSQFQQAQKAACPPPA